MAESSLCANNCGFFGNSETQNLCSKCYREHVLRENRSTKMDALVSAAASMKLTSTPEARSVCEAAASRPSRCGSGGCKKRVGLIGFRCKCGTTYCGTHRLPEDHSCTYNFKTLGKQVIAKANPLVKAPKLE